MATVTQEIETGVLTELISLWSTNQQAAETEIQGIEQGGLTQLTALIKDIPSVKGALSVFTGPLEAAAEAAILSYAQSLVTKYGPTVIYTLIGNQTQERHPELKQKSPVALMVDEALLSHTIQGTGSEAILPLGWLKSSFFGLSMKAVA
jgi:hypothetical protein